tara:strand:+ start:290 stop:529 length:240 start_codon:yes stop_codon:yes gene_type:complete
MAVDKKYHKIIEEGFKDIFKTDTQKGSQNYKVEGLDGLITIIKEPLVKHQIVQLAKLCEKVPVSVALKRCEGGISIEFW